MLTRMLSTNTSIKFPAPSDSRRKRPRPARGTSVSIVSLPPAGSVRRFDVVARGPGRAGGWRRGRGDRPRDRVRRRPGRLRAVGLDAALELIGHFAAELADLPDRAAHLLADLRQLVR